MFFSAMGFSIALHTFSVPSRLLKHDCTVSVSFDTLEAEFYPEQRADSVLMGAAI